MVLNCNTSWIYACSFKHSKVFFQQFCVNPLPPVVGAQHFLSPWLLKVLVTELQPLPPCLGMIVKGDYLGN